MASLDARVRARPWAIVAGYAALSVWMTWPLVTRPGTSLPGDFGDPAFVSWVMAWVSDHLARIASAISRRGPRCGAPRSSPPRQRR